jgi:hypothetical protein
MHIIQTRKIRFLMRKSRLPKIVPHLASGRSIQAINPLRLLLVQECQHLGKTLGSAIHSRRMRNKVIMIREDRPRLQFPIKIAATLSKPRCSTFSRLDPRKWFCFV